MHCVDLGASFPRHILLQILALAQPITSLEKFARSPRTDYYYRSPRCGPAARRARRPGMRRSRTAPAASPASRTSPAAASSTRSWTPRTRASRTSRTRARGSSRCASTPRQAFRVSTREKQTEQNVLKHVQHAFSILVQMVSKKAEQRIRWFYLLNI